MAEKKISILGKVSRFFRECKSEVKKIVWPTPDVVFRNTGVVLVMIIIIGIFIFALDTGLLNLLGTVMTVSK